MLLEAPHTLAVAVPLQLPYRHNLPGPVRLPGGNPLATACGAAVMSELIEGGVLAHAAQMGKILGERLDAMASRLGRKRIVEARGVGLLRALELTAPAAKIIDGCREEGVLVISAGANVVRLAPPLIIDESQIERGTQILEAVLAREPGYTWRAAIPRSNCAFAFLQTPAGPPQSTCS